MTRENKRSLDYVALRTPPLGMTEGESSVTGGTPVSGDTRQSWYRFSPAGMATGMRFWRGGSGQVA